MWVLVLQGLILEKKRKKKAKYDLGSDTSSVWNFCACCPDVISRGNQGRRRNMLAVFSG